MIFPESGTSFLAFLPILTPAPFAPSGQLGFIGAFSSWPHLDGSVSKGVVEIYTLFPLFRTSPSSFGLTYAQAHH